MLGNVSLQVSGLMQNEMQWPIYYLVRKKM
jgi:hypothetical protein